MIQDFADDATEQFFKTRQRPKTGWQTCANVAARKLDMLDAATSLNDLRAPPNNRLELLTDDRAGQHSIRINGQWRLCFVWTTNGPDHVEITDYH